MSDLPEIKKEHAIELLNIYEDLSKTNMFDVEIFVGNNVLYHQYSIKGRDLCFLVSYDGNKIIKSFAEDGGFIKFEEFFQKCSSEKMIWNMDLFQE